MEAAGQAGGEGSAGALGHEAAEVTVEEDSEGVRKSIRYSILCPGMETDQKWDAADIPESSSVFLLMVCFYDNFVIGQLATAQL